MNGEILERNKEIKMGGDLWSSAICLMGGSGGGGIRRQLSRGSRRLARSAR